MGCSQSISAAIADTKVSSGLKKIDIFPESISVNNSRIEHAAGASAETTASGLTRGNSSDSLPSNYTTNNNNNHHHCLNASGSTTEGSATPPSPVKATHHFDIDEAAESQLKDRSVALFGHSKKNKDDADDDDDPFADDSSAVFEVDEDFLLLDDCDNLSTTSVQDALRGLTLDARMSLVELVRSNSVGHIMTA